MASSAIAMPPMSSTIPRVRTMTHIRCRPKNTLPRHVRSFNTSKPAPAIHGASAMPKNMMAQMPPQQGIRSRMKDLGRQEIPNDLGLMPMTLIRPPGKDLPSLFGADWKYRIKFEWLWVKTRFQNFFTLYYFLRSTRPKSPETKKKMKLPYDLVERTRVARNLQGQYYIALAEGDMSTIKRIACKGLVESSERRIGKRRPGQDMSFVLMAYLGMRYPQFLGWPLLSMLPFSATKIVSDKVSPLPFGKGNLIRQCVVRIRSRQKLDAYDGKGPKIAEVTEFVLIQRMRIDEQDEGWKIWGTTRPSTREEIEKQLGSSLGSSSKTPRFMDTLQGQFSKLTGM